MRERNAVSGIWGYEPDKPSVDPMWGYAPAEERPWRSALRRQPRSRLATASLIVGILGVVLAVATIVVPGLMTRVVALVPTVVLGILAIVFSVMVLNGARKSQLGGKALARAGLILGIVDLSLATAVVAAILVVLLVEVMAAGRPI
jgi:lysylphosphatidylglycerol synthetase-like protein (DUF2156 family)